jgi:hypothetical protein
VRAQAFVIRVFREGSYWVATAKGADGPLPQRGTGPSSVGAHCDLLEKIATA